jgi:hypothetical protein
VEKVEENKRNLDKELDILEREINELRISYEQHFSGYLPRPPEKEHAAVKRMIRTLHGSAFKNTANNFRLNVLNNRFQTYATKWERIQKQREAGTYRGDVFKANLQTKNRMALERERSKAGAADKQIQQLFKSYENALRKNGGSTKDLDYQAFKRSLIKKADTVRKSSGAKGVGYQIVIANGKVRVKANPKE